MDSLELGLWLDHDGNQSQPRNNNAIGCIQNQSVSDWLLPKSNKNLLLMLMLDVLKSNWLAPTSNQSKPIDTIMLEVYKADRSMIG